MTTVQRRIQHSRSAGNVAGAGYIERLAAKICGLRLETVAEAPGDLYSRASTPSSEALPNDGAGREHQSVVAMPSGFDPRAYDHENASHVAYYSHPVWSPSQRL